MESFTEDYMEQKREKKVRYEMQVIGSMLNDYSRIPEVMSKLTEDMFSSDPQKAFRIIKEHYYSGAISPKLLEQLFYEEGLIYEYYMDAGADFDEISLENCMKWVLEYYMSIEGDSLLKSYTYSNLMSTSGYETLKDLYSELGELLTLSCKFKKEPTVEDNIDLLFNDLMNKDESSRAIYSKDIPMLNKATGGMLPGNFVVLAGFLKSGKSTTALTIMTDIALKSGVPSAFFSLEMSKNEVYAKIVSNICNVPYGNLRNPDGVKESLLEGYKALAKQKLSGAKIMIDTDAMTLESIVQKIRYYKHKYGLGFVVVDYIQLIDAGGRKFENDERKIAFISRTLKALAKELGIVVMGIGQLNRSAEASPMTTTMAGSLNICKDADALLIVYSPLRVEAAKNNSVINPEATITCNFKGEHLKVGIDKFILYLAESRHTQSGEKALLQMEYGSRMREIRIADKVE